MRINEVADPVTSQLLALAQFALGRAQDEGGQKQVSTNVFLKWAQGLGIDIGAEQLQDLISKPPLDGIMLPMEPGQAVIKFREGSSEPIQMPVNKAQDIVASAAKSAMKRDRSV